MGRHNNTESAYQIEVLDFSRRRNRHYGLRGTPNGKGRKEEDRLPVADHITKVFRFRNPEAAKRWAAKKGKKKRSIISCHKVDISPYLQNIEHLNLNQEPLTIEVEQDYVLNKVLELTRPRKPRIIVVDGIDKKE